MAKSNRKTNRTNNPREKLEARFLTITSIVVAVLALPAFVSFLREPNLTVLASSSLAKGNRQPASIDANLGVPVPPDITVETVKIDCKSPVKEIQTKAHQVRIVANNCADAIKLTEVVNKANGFTAAIFENNKNISTDFIDLNVGANTVQLNAKNTNQNKVLIINRRAPASVQD